MGGLIASLFMLTRKTTGIIEATQRVMAVLVLSVEPPIGAWW